MIELSFLQTEEDLYSALEIITKLFNESYHKGFSTFDVQAVLLQLKEASLVSVNTINKTHLPSIAIAIKADGRMVGIICGKVTNPIFNPVERIALEVAFYIYPDFRSFNHIRLLYGAFKQWAKLVGCQTIMMGRIREPGKQEEYFLKRIV